MKSAQFKICLFIIWSAACLICGYITAKNRAEKKVLVKTVTVYKEKEQNTLEQEKTADKIKVIYRDLKSDEKDCNFVLDFDVSKCLPKSSK